MRSGFFNSDIQGYDSNGNPLYDRAEDAEFFAKYFSSFIGNGVYPNPSNNFQVETAEGMYVKVNPGLAFIEGYFAWEEVERTLAVQSADTTYDRIDRVVLRLNFSTRDIDLYVVKGNPGSSPVPPLLTRPASGQAGDVFEICLSNLFVVKNSTSIPQHRITDTRGDSDVCGLVNGVINQVDISTLYKQYQDSLDTFLGIVQSALDESLAGNLQNQILGVSGVSLITLTTSGWTQLGEFYEKSVPLIGMRNNYVPHWDIDLSSYTTIDAVSNVLEEYSKILMMITGTDELKFYVKEIPSMEMTIIIKGVM